MEIPRHIRTAEAVCSSTPQIHTNLSESACPHIPTRGANRDSTAQGKRDLAGLRRVERRGRAERHMGRWSRLVADEFVAWPTCAPGAWWLDVGCGSGTVRVRRPRPWRAGARPGCCSGRGVSTVLLETPWPPSIPGRRPSWTRAAGSRCAGRLHCGGCGARLRWSRLRSYPSKSPPASATLPACGIRSCPVRAPPPVMSPRLHRRPGNECGQRSGSGCRRADGSIPLRARALGLRGRRAGPSTADGRPVRPLFAAPPGDPAKPRYRPALPYRPLTPPARTPYGSARVRAVPCRLGSRLRARGAGRGTAAGQ